jgi:hypothetical protein
MSILQRVRDRWIKFVTGMEPTDIPYNKTTFIELCVPETVNTIDEKYDILHDVVQLLDNQIKIKSVSKPKSKSKTKSK